MGIENCLYNIAAFLAGVGAGCDVRQCHIVSPVQVQSRTGVSLQTRRASRDEEERRWGFSGITSGVAETAVAGTTGTTGTRFTNSIGDYEMPSYQGYPHNTYHGQVRHYRTPLNLDPKPLRFTDNPQLYSGLTSQRRRSSNASNDSEVS
jgi:hypothetical protein